MAKTTRIKLNDVSTSLYSISKELNIIIDSLKKTTKVVNDDLNKSIKKNLNQSIRMTRVEVDNLFNDIDKGSKKLNKSLNVAGTLGMAALGNTKLGQAFSLVGELSTKRQSNIEAAEEQYSQRYKTITSKRKDVKKEYSDWLTRLSKKVATGEITQEQYQSYSGAALRQKQRKEASLDAQLKKAQDVKESTIAANSISSLAKEATLSITAMVVKEVIKLTEKIYTNVKKTIDDVASYSISSSYKVNSQAREQMLTYGLSESQNYAFTQTKSLMGITSDEDLFWMNDNQRAMFTSLMEKETEIYDKMLSNGTLEGFQEMQIDMAILKQEFYAEIVKFVSDNKELILNTMDVTVSALTGLLQVTTWIFNAVQKTNPFYWFDKLFSGKDASSITLNTYVTSNSADAQEVAEASTNSTLATLSTYVNS